MRHVAKHRRSKVPAVDGFRFVIYDEIKQTWTKTWEYLHACACAVLTGAVPRRGLDYWLDRLNAVDQSGLILSTSTAPFYRSRPDSEFDQVLNAISLDQKAPQRS